MSDFKKFVYVALQTGKRRMVGGESLLYTGSGLPPVKYLSLRCIVILDLCNAVVIIKQMNFYDNFSINYFGPVGTFNSNEVLFYI